MVEVTPLAEDEVADVGSEVVVEVKFDMVELMLLASVLPYQI